MADRPLTFTERESLLQDLSRNLGAAAVRMAETTDVKIANETIDEMQRLASALDYTVRWDAGHDDLPPLQRERPIIVPVPVQFVGQHPGVLHHRMLAVDDPNAAPDAKPKERELGWVSTTAGQAQDYILLAWRDERAVMFGRDMLRAWLSVFTPVEASAIPWSPIGEGEAQ